MSDTEKFTLRQVIGSAALESKGLTAELLALLEEAIKNNSKLDELIPLLVDGRS